MDERLSRMLFRLARTFQNAEHPVRRLRAAILALYEAHLMTSDLERELVHEIDRLENGANSVNDAVEQLAGRLRRVIEEPDA